MKIKAADMKKAVGEILERYNSEKHQLVSILQDVQAHYNYLPKEALVYVSSEMNIPLSQIYSVSTFFKAFSLKPKGKHTIQVCMGTACHVRGADKILSKLEQELCIASGETSKDMQYTLETVNCVGACALGPLVVLDGEYVGNMTTNKVKSMLEKCE